MRFELVQPGELYEYYYSIIGNDGFSHGEIRYYDEGWKVAFTRFARDIEYYDWMSIGGKINQLNEATKADKLFGFL